MPAPWLLLTGFGPFFEVERNPSGELARALDGERVGGLSVRGVELPVSLDGSARALDEALAAGTARGGAAPAALLCTGVQRGAWLRLERRARAILHSEKPDNEGRVLAGHVLAGAPQLETGLALEPLAEALRASGAPDVRVSEDAGGFVCERVYHHALTRGAEAGLPALFLHVPPVEAVPVDVQAGWVRGLIASLELQL